MEKVDYRRAGINDVERICKFVDFWLSGRGMKKGAPGAVNDYFVSVGQQRKYVKKYTTLIALLGDEIVGWAVMEPAGTLIHLLVKGDIRGKGIGKKMVQILEPKTVRSKSDQSSGDPIGFYEKIGYRRVERVKSMSRLDSDEVNPGRVENIDIFKRMGKIDT
ncbi:MAG: GNAT family N-acetyltransferase [Sedimentisphaerales bacterium]